MQLSDEKKQLEKKIEEFQNKITNLNNNNNVDKERLVKKYLNIKIIYFLIIYFCFSKNKKIEDLTQKNLDSLMKKNSQIVLEEENKMLHFF